jgi:hypothetical protein
MEDVGQVSIIRLVVVVALKMYAVISLLCFRHVLRSDSVGIPHVRPKLFRHVTMPR